MLASNENKQVQGNSPVVRYFVRKCRHCGGVMKLQRVGKELLNLDGCRRYYLWTYRPTDSHKTVTCINHPESNSSRVCGRNALVSSFQEIIP